MRFTLFSRKDPSIVLRKNDVLTRRMCAIRKAHKVKQVDLGACMKLGEQAIKAIESGRQQLPGIQPTTGTTLRQWFDGWFSCLSVTPGERREIEDLLLLRVLGNIERNQQQLKVVRLQI